MFFRKKSSVSTTDFLLGRFKFNAIIYAHIKFVSNILNSHYKNYKLMRRISCEQITKYSQLHIKTIYQPRARYKYKYIQKLIKL